MTKLVVSRVFVCFVIIESIAKSVDWEASTHPRKEHIIRDILLRSLILQISFVWHLEISVIRLTCHVLSRSSRSTEHSHILSKQDLNKTGNIREAKVDIYLQNVEFYPWPPCDANSFSININYKLFIQTL